MRNLVAALFVILLCSLTTLPVSAISGLGGHGCAWPVPPGIAGSPAPAPAASGTIVINEVLLVPHSTWNCSETGTYFSTTDAWIELYNTQSQPFNLYAAHALIDSGPNTNAYSFPFGAAIAAHGYLVVFPRTSPGFVSTETSTLRLVIPNVVVDQIIVPSLGPDQSYTRTSDGASNWKITSTPTIDASNTSLPVTPTSPPGGQVSGSGGTGSSSTGSTGTTHESSNSNHKVLVNGVQPRWNSLQFPSITPTSTVDLRPTTQSTPVNSGFDLPRRIALTVLLIALALTLFWCWKVFKKPGASWKPQDLSGGSADNYSSIEHV